LDDADWAPPYRRSRRAWSHAQLAGPPVEHGGTALLPGRAVDRAPHALGLFFGLVRPQLGSIRFGQRFRGDSRDHSGQHRAGHAGGRHTGPAAARGRLVRVPALVSPSPALVKRPDPPPAPPAPARLAPP